MNVTCHIRSKFNGRFGWYGDEIQPDDIINAMWGSDVLPRLPRHVSACCSISSCAFFRHGFLTMMTP